MEIIALITDEISQSRSPKPEIDTGPRRVTIIPPPIIIKTHIANKNPNKLDFKMHLHQKCGDYSQDS